MSLTEDDLRKSGWVYVEATDCGDGCCHTHGEWNHRATGIVVQERPDDYERYARARVSAALEEAAKIADADWQRYGDQIAHRIRAMKETS